VSGALRMRVEDEWVDLGPLDAMRVPAGVWRGFEAGPDGVELLAFGAPNTDNGDAEMDREWWG